MSGAESFVSLQVVDFAEAVDDRVAALLTAGTGITLTYNDGSGTLTIASTVSPTWGSIGGTLSNQTDLQAALNAKIGGSTGSVANRVLTANGTGGSTVQASVVTIDGSGNASGLGTVGCGAITSTGQFLNNLGTITASRPLSITETWNAGGVTFAALSVAVTDTASAAASTVIDLSVGGTRRFAVRKDGVIELSNSHQINPVSSSANLRLSPGGTSRFFFGTDNSFALGPAMEVVLVPDATNLLSQRSGTAAQTSRLYNTFTSSTNGEWLQSQWASGEARIGTAVGSAGGTQRSTVLGAWNSSNTWTAALTIGTTGNLTASALVTLGTYTAATLPSASANAGAIAQVTDSSVTTNGSAVSGGGSNRVVVFSNGSTWDVVVA